MEIGDIVFLALCLQSPGSVGYECVYLQPARPLGVPDTNNLACHT